MRGQGILRLGILVLMWAMLGWAANGKEEIVLRQEVTEIEIGERRELLIAVQVIEGDVEVLGEDRVNVEVRIEDFDDDHQAWEFPRARFDENAEMLWVSLGPHFDNNKLILRVPAAASLRVDVKDGDIELSGVKGEIEATTVDGEISLEQVGGGIVANTIDGDISIRLTDTKLVNPISLATVDGDIELEAGKGFEANLQVSTIDGSFRTDFTVTQDGGTRRNPWRGIVLQGRIGAGGPNVSLKTIDGDITLERK